MSKEKKCAIGCCCTVIIIVILVGTGAAGWFLALSELLIGFVCDTLNLLHGQLENANRELGTLLGQVINETGIDDPLDDTRWLEEPRFYTKPLVTVTDKQEQGFLEQYGDIFLTNDEYERLNQTDNGQLGDLVGDEPDPGPDCPGEGPAKRRKRQGGYSRICPGYVPGSTQLVAFHDGGSGQMVQLNNYVQWVFNEECYNTYCSPGGCSCRKVQRTETALVYVIDASTGQLSGSPIQRSVIVFSCVAVV